MEGIVSFCHFKRPQIKFRGPSPKHAGAGLMTGLAAQFHEILGAAMGDMKS